MLKGLSPKYIIVKWFILPLHFVSFRFVSHISVSLRNTLTGNPFLKNKYSIWIVYSFVNYSLIAINPVEKAKPIKTLK